MVHILTLLHLSADVIVCLDACFSQKRNKTKGKGGQQDPPNDHPSSVFMSDADVKVVEDFVDALLRLRAAAPKMTDMSQA
jgi:hypothetical protein